MITTIKIMNRLGLSELGVGIGEIGKWKQGKKKNK